jgi:hypothetical protein
MQHPRTVRLTRIVVPLFFVALLLAVVACAAPQQIQFGLKHLRDRPGQIVTEVLSYDDEPGLDNAAGEAPLQVQVNFDRTFRHIITIRLSDNAVPQQEVQNKLVELYKLPVNDPQGEVQTSLCPVSVIIPAGQKVKITVEWTERWAEGVINEGTEAAGRRLGTYEVFLGYVEPCSLVNQENVE